MGHRERDQAIVSYLVTCECLGLPHPARYVRSRYRPIHQQSRKEIGQDPFMRFTPNEVALITSGMATAMALVTVVVARLNARDTLRHQREQAHDERLWRGRS